MNKRKAFTLIELLVVVAIIALLISILLPSLSRAREITKRAVCASQLRGIGTGCKTYSNDNSDWYPVNPAAAPDVNGLMTVQYIGKMGNLLTTTVPGVADTQVHPSRALFMLVSDTTCTVQQFVCPSSGDTADDLRNKSGSTDVACQPNVNRFDFKGYNALSYGYQLPYGAKGRPNENLDTRMAIAADKGPYARAGALNSSTGVTPDAVDTQGSELQIANAGTEQLVLRLDNEKWRAYNSRNHGGEGENCLYQDGHVSFERRPIIGVNNDNIYTVQKDYTMVGCLLGNRPDMTHGPFTQTDSMIVP